MQWDWKIKSFDFLIKQKTEWISSRPDELPQLLTFHLKPDEMLLTDEMHDKMKRLCYTDAGEKHTG